MKLILMRRLLLLNLTMFGLFALLTFAQKSPTIDTSQSEKANAINDVAGYWEGKISYRGSSQQINLDVKEQNSNYSASIDIPAMGMLDVALEDFSFQKNEIKFSLPLGRGEILARYKADKIIGETSDDEYDEFRVLLTLERGTKKPLPYKKENVVFYNNNIKLAGTLITPSDNGPHPAVVVLHGSNPRTRDFFIFNFLGDVFARNGIAVLLYDGRGAGESTGDFQTANFRDLAEDALAGVKFLKTRNDVKTDKIGLWGISQGGWVAPEAASISQDVAFLIIVSGAAVNPGDQMNFSTSNLLRENNFSNEKIERAITLRNKVNSYYQGKVSRDEAQAAIDKSRAEDWFPLASLPGGGNLPKEFSRSKWYREVNYDPLPALEKIKIPVLILWGNDDPIMPIKESLPIWKKAFQKARNKNVTYKGFAGADHILSVSSKVGEQWDWRRIAPNYSETMLNWLSQNLK